MAIVKCHECGREISTEAKTCPQCGARNRSRKKSKSLKWILALAAVGVVFAAYKVYEAASGPNFCESYLGRRQFVGIFERGSYAQREKLRIVDVMSQKVVSRGERPEDLVCEFNFRLNDGRKLTYTLRFVKSDTATGGYLIHIKPK